MWKFFSFFIQTVDSNIHSAFEYRLFRKINQLGGLTDLNCAEAFKTLHSNYYKLYPTAFQSFLWNLYVSTRTNSSNFELQVRQIFF